MSKRTSPGLALAVRKNLQEWRAATLGRVCKWCKDDDSEKRFEERDECSACARQRHRPPCFLCGGPFIRDGKGRSLVGCVVRNRIPYGLSCKAEVA